MIFITKISITHKHTHTHTQTHTQTHTHTHTMDARTQRRINRAKRRDEILRKEKEEKEKSKILRGHRVRWVESATKSQVEEDVWDKPNSDNAYIDLSKKRMEKLFLNETELWHLNAAHHYDRVNPSETMFRSVRWPVIMHKIQGMANFSKSLKNYNEVLIGRCREYKKQIDAQSLEIDELKRQLQIEKDKITKVRKWRDGVLSMIKNKKN